MLSIYVLCLFIVISATNGYGLGSDLYVSKFDVVHLTPLQPKAIEQNLTFRLNNESYVFALRPRSAVLNSETNISLVRNTTRSEVKLNPENYVLYNVDGYLIGNSTVTITGTVNHLGYFEGYFGLGDYVYFIQPHNTTPHFIEGSFAIDTNIGNICPKSVANGSQFRIWNDTKLSNDLVDFREVGDGSKPHAETNPSILQDAIKLCPQKPKILSRRRNVNMDPELDLQRQLKPLYSPLVGEPALLSKRSASNATYLCNLKIVADHKFFKYVCRSDSNKTVIYIVSLMTKVDDILRKIDFNMDGISDNIGIYIDDIHIYKDDSKDEKEEWNPVKFFKEFAEYDFTGACAGLVFTFRQMQTPETLSPSLIKTQLTSGEQGLCSTYRPRSLPGGKMDDYGEFISNALPVNFQLGSHYASDNTMIAAILHQLGHLFGAPNDDFYTEADACYKQMKGKRFAMAIPPPSGFEESHLTYSPCSLMAMAGFLSKSSRPCLRSCEGAHCSLPLLGVKPNVKIFQRNLTAAGAVDSISNVTERIATRWREMCFTIPDSSNSVSLPIKLIISTLALLYSFIN